MRFVDFDSIGLGKARLKPELGDTVVYEGQKYIVTEVGLKYVHMKHAETGALGFAKIMEVTKFTPEQPTNTDKLENFGEFA